MNQNDRVILEMRPHSRDWIQRVLSIHNQFVVSLEWTEPASDLTDTNGRLQELIDHLVETNTKDLPAEKRQQLKRDVLAETIGLGPLEPLLADPLISDILVNSHTEVFIEKQGRLIRTPIEFADREHLMRIIQRVAGRVGRRIDESSPMVDARLEDGSRVHAVVPPLAFKGPTLSIRRFGHRPLSLDDLIAHGSISENMVLLLAAAVRSRISFLISGGTGAGKTTLLNAISAHIPSHERIVTIEDAGELRLQHPHVVSLEARPANSEGHGQVTIRNLVRTSLRMRPDRILVGEVRGAEVIDMLQAMNTGHPGSLTTIHANDTKDALSRLEVMVGMHGYEFPIDVLRHYITSGIQLLVHVARLDGGVRRVTQIVEILGLKNGNYRLKEIFGFRQTGLDGDGCAIGEFYETGYLPKFHRQNTRVRKPVISEESSEIDIAHGRRAKINVMSWSVEPMNEISSHDPSPPIAIESMPHESMATEPSPGKPDTTLTSETPPPLADAIAESLSRTPTPITVGRNQTIEIHWDTSGDPSGDPRVEPASSASETACSEAHSNESSPVETASLEPILVVPTTFFATPDDDFVAASDTEFTRTEATDLLFGSMQEKPHEA